MDPPANMNHGEFRSGSATPYNLAEIWPFQFGQSLGQFTDNPNREDDPMVLDQREERKRRQDDDSIIGVSTSSAANGTSDSDSKRLKASGSKDEKLESKVETEANSGKQAEQCTKPTEPPIQDYIHVRARRGEATDSHSLAERARREKISERMKILQDLVPCCNKVIGKALVLDEIINYIQSLQRQVEFLSMKLEAVNSRTSPSIEGFPSKDVNLLLQYGQHTLEMAGVTFASQAPTEFSRGS